MLHEELIVKAVSKVGVLVLFFARNVRNHRVKKKNKCHHKLTFTLFTSFSFRWDTGFCKISCITFLTILGKRWEDECNTLHSVVFSSCCGNFNSVIWIEIPSCSLHSSSPKKTCAHSSSGHVHRIFLSFFFFLRVCVCVFGLLYGCS